jgi:predicted ferric reductase
MLALALAISLAQAAPQQEPPPEDFELLPKEAAPDPAAVARQKELERKLALRRRMLQMHQLSGFFTLGGLALTAVLGQLNYMDKYGGGGDTGKYYEWHRWTAITTATIFAGTAALAVFAPSPLEKPVRLDTVTLHKIALFTASAGMAAQIVLGIVTASREGKISQRDFALAHQIVGYTTVVASFAGFTVLTFQ